jgi:uracil-DNA glycosylase
MDRYAFGYPRQCSRCASFSKCSVNLQVVPHFYPGGSFRLMLIGQDPTIRNKPERVREALMLDDPHSQLSRWLTGLFGPEQFSSMTIYSTNVVKCTLGVVPSTMRGGGTAFLRPYFDHCAEYLQAELLAFRPTLVLTLGEPAHQLFVGMLDDPESMGKSMQDAFTGEFPMARFRGVEFRYSPCLHIQTFRVAETYGRRVEKFKEGLENFIKTSG